MKVNTLFSIIVKVIGLLALWKFVSSVGGIVFGVGLFATVGQGMQGGFMTAVILNLLLSTGAMGIVAFIFLFSTDNFIRLLKIDGEATVKIGDRALTFDVLVLLAALLLIINGMNEAITYDYKTDTNTVTNNDINTGSFNNTTTNVQSQTKHVNYFAVMEAVLGLIILLKASEVSVWLMSRFPEEKKPKEEPEMYRQL